MKVVVSDFRSGIGANVSSDLASLKKSQMCYNFGFFGGGLKSDAAFEGFFDGKAAESGLLDSLLGGKEGLSGGCVFLYRRYDYEAEKEDDKLVIFDENFSAFYINLAESEPVLRSLGVKFSSRPNGISYKLFGEDVFIMTSSGDNMVVWNGVDEPEIVVDAPLISSMDIHYERLFATTVGSKQALKFSDDLDPTNWSESLNDAGFIEMNDPRGKLLKVLSFNDYLYVFRERGITRVYANTVSQENFYVNHLFTAGGEIFDKTIALCGDKIIFVASDGFYLFDGSNASRRLDNLFPLISVSALSKAEYFGGKYYLACKVDFGDDEFDDNRGFNNALVEIDAESLEYRIIRGENVLDILSFASFGESALLVLTTDKLQPLKKLVRLSYLDYPKEETSIVSKFVSGKTNITSGKTKKVLRKISVISYGGAEISFVSEVGERVSVLAEGDGLNEFGVFLPFRTIQMEIKTRLLGARVEEVELLFW